VDDFSTPGVDARRFERVQRQAMCRLKEAK